MKITHNGKTYQPQYDGMSIEYYIEEAISDGTLELITKPEEKPTEEELLQKRMDDYIYKSDNLPKSIMVEGWGDSYDKAMDEIHGVEEIPEVSEDKEDNPFTPLGLDIQRRAMVTSLNRLIKHHNNK